MSKENKIAYSGNKGEKVRSDCHITLKITNNNGIKLEIESKVNALFGKSIRDLAEDMLKYFGIANAEILIEDSGALPFVIGARIEYAIKQLITTNKKYLFDVLEENKYHTEKDLNRFTRLYLPGNSPNLMINAGLHKPDGIILDLEDAVAFNKKSEARFLVRNALCQVNFYASERMLRINQIPAGLDDLEYVIPYNVNLLLVPKCENPDQIKLLNEKIEEIKKENNIDKPVWLMPIIESALGIVNSFEIASAAENIVALAIGLEDYTADIGTRRTNEGRESFFARTQIVNRMERYPSEAYR